MYCPQSWLSSYAFAPEQCSGQKNEEIWRIFYWKMYFVSILGAAIAPSAPGYTYVIVLDITFFSQCWILDFYYFNILLYTIIFQVGLFWLCRGLFYVYIASTAWRLDPAGGLQWFFYV